MIYIYYIYTHVYHIWRYWSWFLLLLLGGKKGYPMGSDHDRTWKRTARSPRLLVRLLETRLVEVLRFQRGQVPQCHSWVHMGAALPRKSMDLMWQNLRFHLHKYTMNICMVFGCLDYLLWWGVDWVDMIPCGFGPCGSGHEKNLTL